MIVDLLKPLHTLLLARLARHWFRNASRSSLESPLYFLDFLLGQFFLQEFKTVIDGDVLDWGRA